MNSKSYKKFEDYASVDIYFGIDVHLKDYKIAVSMHGVIVKTFSMEASPEKLVEFILKNYPKGNYYSVYEAGFSGFKLHRQLESAGIKNIVVNPADVPTSDKEKRRKTDRIDTSKLARELAVRNLHGIWIPSEKQEAKRDLIRRRGQLIEMQTQQKNQIKCYLYKIGIQIPTELLKRKWGESFITYLKELPLDIKEQRVILDSLIESLKLTMQQIEDLVESIKKMLAENTESKDIIKYLQSIPGIGFSIAIGVYAEILDINRFDTLNNLASFTGLTPSCHSSGDREDPGYLTKRQNRRLRTFMIEAAWVAIRVDPVLITCYGRLRKGHNGQVAIIRIAKKLLNRILYVWRNQTEYVVGVVE